MSKLQTFDPHKKNKAVQRKKAMKQGESVLSVEIEELGAYVDRKTKTSKGTSELLHELAILVRTKL